MKLLPFDDEIILENETVLLRPLVGEDYSTLLHFAINEPTLWDYSHMPGNGKENMYNYLTTALSKRAMKDSYPFIVFDKITQKYAGSTRFYDYQKVHNTVQLGYTWYGKEFQGTHVNKNCKYLMLEYAFEELQVERVEFRADNKNSRSIAAMKSIGCTVEGVLRNNCAAHKNGRRDSIILSILKEEWFENRKAQLHSKLVAFNHV
ncbi:MAG: GNAT family protein [Bacteroidota bacterium]